MARPALDLLRQLANYRSNAAVVDRPTRIETNSQEHMTTDRARVCALVGVAATLLTNAVAAQSVGKWSLCGAGQYDLTAAGQPAGSETFEIRCSAGGYTGTGRTRLAAGAMSLDLTTKLELGTDLVPKSASANGTIQGNPFDQTAALANGTATVTIKGQTQSLPYTPGASWLGSNIFYPNVFIVARYDEAKGGAQQVPIFPTLSITIEREATDAARLGNESASFDRFTLRIAGQEIVLWRDAAGKLAIISIPAQQFAAMRPESAKWLPALLDSRNQNPSPSAIDYSAPPGAWFTAEQVKIPVATYSLAGTLLVPKGAKSPSPAVVMITGSGLQTRDSRVALPGLEKYAPFRQIAERLAVSGIAVLRVDDRGSGGSTGLETLENATTTSFAEDTRAQVAWLRARKEIDPRRIVLIGHSEGASIAAMIGASDPDLVGVVMMAGVGRRGGDVSLEQQEDALRSETTMSEATRDSLRAKQREIVKTVLAGGSAPGISAWIREYFGYDPLPTVRKVKQPLLILQGERDRQVDQSHATLLADAAREAGNKNVTVTVLPTLNHLFLPSKTGSVSEYSHLGTLVVPDVVLDALVNWVTKITGVKPRS
jgi:dienelactone hydrolase